MSWYRITYSQGSFVDPMTVYQSPDFPYVFLGGADEDQLKVVEQTTGKPICIRVDLRSHSPRESFFFEEVPEAHMRVPLPDNPPIEAPTQMNEWQAVFNKTVDQLAEIIARNQCPIYVHCSAGMNRSVATLVAALAKLTGREFADILGEMKQIRPVVHPNPTYLQWGQQAAEENIERDVA